MLSFASHGSSTFRRFYNLYHVLCPMLFMKDQFILCQENVHVRGNVKHEKRDMKGAAVFHICMLKR